MAELETNSFANAIPVEGPEGLMQALEDLLAKVKSEPEASKEYVLLYQLGKQRSIIKVDFNQEPCHFWYQDTLGRPITKAVENTIAEFLWTKCGERERYLKESSREST